MKTYKNKYTHANWCRENQSAKQNGIGRCEPTHIDAPMAWMQKLRYVYHALFAHLYAPVTMTNRGFPNQTRKKSKTINNSRRTSVPRRPSVCVVNKVRFNECVSAILAERTLFELFIMATNKREDESQNNLDYVLNEIGDFSGQQIWKFLWIGLPIALSATFAITFVVTATNLDYR